MTPVPTARPLILTVDADRVALDRAVGVLQRRFGADFHVRGERTVAAARAVLDDAADHGDPVALVLADRHLPDGAGAELLEGVRSLHPDARRALLIRWGGWADAATAADVRRAMALGDIDYYVVKPWRSPDEPFVRTVAEYVHEWSRGRGDGPAPITVVADPWSQQAHEIRSLLARSGVPHATARPESEAGRAILREAGLDGEASGGVVVAMPALGGRVLLDPSPADVAAAWGVTTALEADDVDLVVVGAGPAGLASAVYGASEGLSTLVVERETLGGQASTSSLIRNYLGFARGISGADLTQRAYQQAWVFGARVLMLAEVDRLRTAGDRHLLDVAGLGEVSTRAVVLAQGVTWRRLGVPELEALTGRGVFYGGTAADARALAGLHAVVVGGANSAGQAALHLARYAASTTLVMRESRLDEVMSRYLVDQVAANPAIEVLTSTHVVAGSGDARLRALVLEHAVTGERRDVPADGLFIMIGAVPKTDWLPSTIVRDTGGYVVTGQDLLEAPHLRIWPLERRPQPYETALPGVFAVGDVRSGSLKRVASAVGEGSVVVSQVLRHLAAG
jgi:thioredoxin reductase (NADPH)